MKTLLNKVVENFREVFDRSIKLVRLLGECPGIRVSLEAGAICIDAQSVVPWHTLGEVSHGRWRRREHGTLMGWRRRDKWRYDSFILQRPEYTQIGRLEVTENWVCDIAEVHGFAASKSELRNFANTDQMVETNSRNMIDAITHKKLAKNLAHGEIRIIHSPGSDYFRRYSWDGRVFLINSGGSHHFAAAKYIAARLPEAVALRGKLHTHSLNALAIASLRRDFEMFVISDSAPISLRFHDAMETLGATWLWHAMPWPLKNAKAILLPKVERQSMVVAALLRKAGAADLGMHLTHLAATQFTH